MTKRKSFLWEWTSVHPARETGFEERFEPNEVECEELLDWDYSYDVEVVEPAGIVEAEGVVILEERAILLMSAEQFRRVNDPSFIGTIPIDELGGERWELHYSAKLGTHLAYRSVETATKQEAS